MLTKVSNLNDFNVLQQNFSSMPEPYSDFSAISLLSWAHGREIYYCLSKGGILLKLPMYLDEGYVYTLYLHSEDTGLLENTKSLTNKLHFVPECSLQYLPQNVETREDRDSFDYIYSLKNLTSLSEVGKNVRHRVRKFDNSFTNVNCRKLVWNHHDDRDKVLALCNEWCAAKHLTGEETQAEIFAISTYISYSDYIEDYSIGIYHKDSLIAFTLNEVHNEWSIGHFGKASYKYRDSSLISEILTARELEKLGVCFLNHQQDTGIQNLRKFKQSLNPTRYLRKYTVVL